jgi:polyphosphate kinase 2 (PPK2 family)
MQGQSHDPKQKLGNKEYEAELFRLQLESVKLQDWVKKTGARIVILFEGRDAAVKGGGASM